MVTTWSPFPRSRTELETSFNYKNVETEFGLNYKIKSAKYIYFLPWRPLTMLDICKSVFQLLPIRHSGVANSLGFNCAQF